MRLDDAIAKSRETGAWIAPSVIPAFLTFRFGWRYESMSKLWRRAVRKDGSWLVYADLDTDEQMRKSAEHWGDEWEIVEVQG